MIDSGKILNFLKNYIFVFLIFRYFST